jgi:hypothetical protein
MKVITFLDLDGRYRVTSPAYADPTAPENESEDECIRRVVVALRAHYRLPANHQFHFVEDADQRTRLMECCGSYFRYAGKPDKEGRRDAKDGAWEMDVDGRPKINMPKAGKVHMDYIRVSRNTALQEMDVSSIRAVEGGDVTEQARIGALKQTLRDIPQTFSLSDYRLPKTLKDAWPTELPAR